MTDITVTSELGGTRVTLPIWIPSTKVTMRQLIEATERTFQSEAFARRKKGEKAIDYRVIKYDIISRETERWKELTDVNEVVNGSELNAYPQEDWWRVKVPIGPDSDEDEPPPNPCAITQPSAQINKKTPRKYEVQSRRLWNASLKGLPIRRSEQAVEAARSRDIDDSDWCIESDVQRRFYPSVIKKDMNSGITHFSKTNLAYSPNERRGLPTFNHSAR
eukprot:TRINITY_DN21043_c0_g1_i1.p1 TRINITY_DN21043_c0_g1~~TRINITY_DN21043_c0_g1_i1.p1  ORF type:complete len:219 (+),score=29.16 TRINITY_DN21043_c0_g1_i1:38-694(+)